MYWKTFIEFTVGPCSKESILSSKVRRRTVYNFIIRLVILLDLIRVLLAWLYFLWVFGSSFQKISQDLRLECFELRDSIVVVHFSIRARLRDLSRLFATFLFHEFKNSSCSCSLLGLHPVMNSFLTSRGMLFFSHL